MDLKTENPNTIDKIKQIAAELLWVILLMKNQKSLSLLNKQLINNW